MTAAPIRVATRRSELAVTQSQHVADELGLLTGRPTELVYVTTQGDVTKGSLTNFGGVGVFVAAVRDAVINGEADIAVHSLKDVPTVAHPELLPAFTPVRADYRDIIYSPVASLLQDLPKGAKVGTGSLRRSAQLRALRNDLEVVDIRGNVPTRMQKADDGEVDAVVLAAAGMRRLSLTDRVTQYLDTDVMLPAPGQGSLAVEARIDLPARDRDLHKSLQRMDDFVTKVAVTSERALLNELEAGCTAPVAALARVRENPHDRNSSEVHLQGLTAAVDGSQVLRMSITGSAQNAAELGRELAQKLLDAGAAGLLGANPWGNK